MHPVTYPPFGTTWCELRNGQRFAQDDVLTSADTPVVVQFTRVRVRAELLHRCGFFPRRHRDLTSSEISKVLLVTCCSTSRSFAARLFAGRGLPPRCYPRTTGSEQKEPRPLADNPASEACTSSLRSHPLLTWASRMTPRRHNLAMGTAYLTLCLSNIPPHPP
jgi:hypothetical protein